MGKNQIKHLDWDQKKTGKPPPPKWLENEMHSSVKSLPSFGFSVNLIKGITRDICISISKRGDLATALYYKPQKLWLLSLQLPSYQRDSQAASWPDHVNCLNFSLYTGMCALSVWKRLRVSKALRLHQLTIRQSGLKWEFGTFLNLLKRFRHKTGKKTQGTLQHPKIGWLLFSWLKLMLMASPSEKHWVEMQFIRE